MIAKEKSTLVLIDEREVSRRLSVSRGLLRYWRARGEGPPWIRVGERLVRYNLGVLRRWVEQQAVTNKEELACSGRTRKAGAGEDS
jgi:predicted DNA-binding transcriptional regulator AlpA